MDFPAWWEWELELTAHVEARMEERGFTEVDLRAMLERASGIEPATQPDRWIVRTRHAGAAWLVAVEPDPEDRRLVVVTAYPHHTRP